jgi:hypothetical protein
MKHIGEIINTVPLSVHWLSSEAAAPVDDVALCAFSGQAYEFRSDVLSLAPHYTIGSVASRAAIAVEKENKIVAKLNAVKDKPHAFDRKVGNQHVARCDAHPKLYGGNSTQAIARIATPFLQIWQNH